MNTFHTAFSLPCIPNIRSFRFLESFFHFRLSNIKERFGFECRGFNCTLMYPLTRAFFLLLSILQITPCKEMKSLYVSGNIMHVQVCLSKQIAHKLLQGRT